MKVYAGPWKNMSEFKEVYLLIYHNDFEMKRKGYERLLRWKSRQPQLPAGLECTLSFIYFQLMDQYCKIQQGSIPVVTDYAIRALYSQGIMRFLNQISSSCDNYQDTLYTMAKKMNIPDLVVNIRHMNSHSPKIPSKDILNYATIFCLKWLEENYWKVELSCSKDAYYSSDNKLLFESLNYLLLKVIGMNKLPISRFDPELINKKLKISTNDLIELSKRPKIFAIFIEKHLNNFLKNSLKLNKHKTVDLILSADIFFPKKVIKLPKLIMKLWKNVIIILHKQKCLNLLIEQILKTFSSPSQHNSYIISLWLKKIFNFLHKIDLLSTSFSKLSNNSKERKQFSKNYQKKRALLLSNKHMISSISPNQFKYYFKEFLKNNIFKHSDLQRLFQLCGSSLTTKTKQDLSLLLRIYTEEDYVFSNDNTDEPVKSLSDITTLISNNENKSEFINKINSNYMSDNLWKNNSDSINWAETFNGNLPSNFNITETVGDLTLDEEWHLKGKDSVVEYSNILNQTL